MCRRLKLVGAGALHARQRKHHADGRHHPHRGTPPPPHGPPSRPRPADVPRQPGPELALGEADVAEVVQLLELALDGRRRLDLEDGVDVAVRVEAAEAPVEEGPRPPPDGSGSGSGSAVWWVGGAAALEGADDEQGRGVEGADEGGVDGVERARGEHRLEGQQGGEGGEVEGRRVGEDGVALDAGKGEHGAAELDLGGRVGDELGEGVAEDGDEDGEEEDVAEEGEGDHERRAEDRVELAGPVDAGAVEAEPRPDEPLARLVPRQRRLVGVPRGGRVVVTTNQPPQGEEEAHEAPDGDEGQPGKVPHHGVHGDEDDVVRQQGEGQAGQQDGRREAEDVHAVAVGDDPSVGEDVVDAGQDVGGEDEAEGDVEEGPQRLGVDGPAVLDDGGELVQRPTGRVDGKEALPPAERRAAPVDHGQHVQGDEGGELAQLRHLPDPRHHQPPLVQQRRPARLVERDRGVLVVVREDVDKGERGVRHDALPDGVHEPLAGRRAQEQLALGDDGELERREPLPLVAVGPPLEDGPLQLLPALALHLLGGALEGVEALDEDVRQDQEAHPARVVLVVAAQHAAGDELAERRPGHVDRVVGGAGVLPQELDTVREEAVDLVVGVVEAVYEWPDNQRVHPRLAELVQRIRVIWGTVREELVVVKGLEKRRDSQHTYARQDKTPDPISLQVVPNASDHTHRCIVKYTDGDASVLTLPVTLADTCRSASKSGPTPSSAARLAESPSPHGDNGRVQSIRSGVRGGPPSSI
ncbi:hypothetical protein CTA1_10714 [Colletotrichum tanaceti]|uniref:Uncharacterized protein n=1 Tax=Colletotrichum tanaceti TaxID=1306861 RepID=A0A4U6X612_9PEZI|nr:hypothetical protein CTA1_10714 [Colletotrichum tanaceti]